MLYWRWLVSLTKKDRGVDFYIFYFLNCEKERKNTPVLSWYCKFPPELCDFKGFKHQLSWWGHKCNVFAVLVCLFLIFWALIIMLRTFEVGQFPVSYILSGLHPVYVASKLCNLYLLCRSQMSCNSTTNMSWLFHCLLALYCLQCTM